MGLTKQQLEALNQSSFPNNNAGAITPDILRQYNAATITNTVNQDTYTTDSASFDARIDAINIDSSSLVSNTIFNAYTQSTNVFTASISTSVGLLQTFSGSQYKADSSSFDTRINSFASSSTPAGTVSSSAQISALGFATTSSVNTLSSSQNFTNSTLVTTSSFNTFSGSQYKADSASFSSRIEAVTGSNVNTSSLVTTASFNAYTQSTNTFTSSISTSVGVLQTFSGSQYKNDSSSFDSRINAATGSTINTGSFATTGSNSFTGSQTINGNIILTGSSAEIQNAKGVGFFNSLYNLDYKLAMPIQNTIGYIDELGLPHYYNGGVQPTISASAAIANHSLVKVTPQEWLNLTASAGNNHYGILSVETSTGWDDINNTFGVHGNAITSGSVNYITQRGLSKIGLFPGGGAKPYIGQPVYVDDNGYQLTLLYPTGSRVLRYGYVASFEQSDPLNMYVRQIFVDPVWEKGETIIDLNVSSSLRVTGSLNVTGSTNFSELTGSLSTFSSSIDSRILAIPTINTGSFATTGSNTFVGNQTITGDITASGNISSSTISGIGNVTLFSSSVDSRLLAAGGQSQIQDEGTILGNATSFNFLGAGVTATFSAGTASVTIAGGGGSVDTGSFITTGSITNSQTIFGNLTVSRSAGSGQNAIDAQGNVNVTDTLTVSSIKISGSGDTGANNMLYPTTLWQSSGDIKFNNYLNVPDPAYTGSILFTATSGSGIRFTGNGGAVVNVNGVIIGSGPSDNAIAIGSASMQSNTGTNSIGIGNASLQSNTTATNNLAIGNGALQLNTTAVSNIAIGTNTLGSQAFSGNGYNIAIGPSVLNLLGSTGGANAQLSQNTIIGANSGKLMTIGARNTIIGAAVWQNANNAERNTGLGRGVLSAIGQDTGIGSGSKYNTAIGHNALFTFDSGSNNTFIHGGSNAGDGVVYGSNNNVIGMDLGLPATMESNTIIGRSIAGLSSPLSNNVIIADGSGNIAFQKNGATGSVRIGTGLEVTGSSSFIGSVSVASTFQLLLPSGSNQQTGLATLDGGNPGTVTVSNSNVTANSIIMLTKQTNNHPNSGPVNVSSKGSGTFTITSNHNGDTDIVAFMIINPS